MEVFHNKLPIPWKIEVKMNMMLIFWKKIIKNSHKIKFNFCLQTVSFYGNYYEKQDGPGHCYQYLAKFYQIAKYVQNFSSISDSSLFHFWSFNSISFWVIPETTVDNFCKPFQDIIIIQSSTSFLNLKISDKKEKNYKTFILRNVHCLDREISFLNKFN